MAVDPQQLATEQDQRQAITQMGAPTEFAQGPEQGVRIAGPAAEGMLELLRRLKPSVQGTRPDGQPDRPPTAQETGIVEDPGGLSLRGAAKAAAPEVLSDEGLARFEAMSYRAPTPDDFAAAQSGVGPQGPNDVLQSATEALDAQALEATQQAEDLRTGAQKALTAETRGFGPESGVAPEQITDDVLAQLSAEELNIKSIVDGGDFNFDYLTTPDSVKATITALSEVLKDPTEAVKRGIRTNEVTAQEAARLAADEIGMTKKLLSRKIGDGSLNAEQMVAGRELLVRSATRLTDLAEKIMNGQATATDKLTFRRQLAIHSGIQMQLKGAQTELARALQSFRIPVSGEMDATSMSAAAQKMLQDGNLEESTASLAKKLLSLSKLPEKERLAAINKFSNKGWYSRTKAAVHEAYLVGLLSAPATHAKNILGTASFMAYQLPAEMISGVYGSALRGTVGRVNPSYLSEDQVYMQDAFLRVKGWSDSFRDALRAGAVAFRTEQPASLATKVDVEAYQPGISSTRGDVFGNSINNFGKMARIPFRFLMASDEFFKTISMRGELYVAANRRYQMSLRMGKTPEEAIDDAGMVLLDPRAVEEDLDLKARYDTLTSDLGIFGKFASKAQDTFFGRFFLPFATAPTNDVLRTSEFVVLNPVAWYRAADYTNPKAQQLALGRLTVGGAVTYTVSQYAANGQITGSLPENEQLRNSLPPGWQPYSIVLRGEGFPTDEDGDPLPLYDNYGRPNGPLTYVSYQGYGPLTSLMGITADTVQRMTMSNDPELRSNLPAAIVFATGDYYKELPMLQGVSEILDILDTGDFKGFLGGPAQAASPLLVPSPISALQRRISETFDPRKETFREDLEYYTLDEVQAGAKSGDRAFLKANGETNYAMVGMAKGDWETAAKELYDRMDSYLANNSMFRDSRDTNALKYDTLGNVIGAEDVSIYHRPGLAMWNSITGIRIQPGREISPMQEELMRLASMNNTFPLSNPEKFEGMKLGAGAQADLVNIAKNELKLTTGGRVSPKGLDFRGALEREMSRASYQRMSDKEKATQLASIQKNYYDKAFRIMIERPEYANMRKAYMDKMSIPEQYR